MPHVDKRSGEIVLRVVYDGLPEAGKTTSVQQLGQRLSLQRRGAMQSPGSAGPRTEFFDWLDFSGGYLDGRRVRCQLVSVPGQPRLLQRRRYLLETADVVVFVSGSRPETVGDDRQCLAGTLGLLGRLGVDVPVAVVVQANKQDLEGALRAAELAAALELAPATPVVEAAALAGTGVIDAFVMAVRLATERVRTLAARGALVDVLPRTETPGELYSALLALVPAPAAPVAPPEQVAPAAPVAPLAQVAPAAPAAPPARVAPAAPGAEPAPPPPAKPPATPAGPGGKTAQRRNALGRGEVPMLPRADEVAAGHIWPSVSGRAMLALANGGKPALPEHLVPWAPAGALEVRTDNGWIFHSVPDWSFPDEAAARLALIHRVRSVLVTGDRHPPDRVLAVAPDAVGWRLWCLTPQMPTLLERVAWALERRSPAELAAARACAAEFAARFREAPGTGARVVGGIAALGITGGRAVVLSIAGDPGEARREPVDPLAHADRIIERAATLDESIRRCVEEMRRTVKERRGP